MIYLDDREDNTLYSIIEGIYLSERFDTRFKNSNILVCPDHTKYVVGKTIIINQPNYSIEKCKELHKNNCTIISRVKLDLDFIKYHPYLIYPEPNIMWNGMYVSVEGLDIIGITKKLEDSIIFDASLSKLYFPKLLDVSESLLYSSSGDLTALGWLMHQVGINVVKDSKFQDLDLLKTRKML